MVRLISLPKELLFLHAMHIFALLCFILNIAIKGVLPLITNKVFTLRTEGCTIANPHASDKLKNIVNAPLKLPTCSGSRQLVTSNSSHIWVVHEALYSFNVFREDTFYCCYRNFAAVTDIRNIIYADCKEFIAAIKVEHEFVRVECYHLDEVIYDDFFLFPSHKAIPLKSSQISESYNIIILGIESMSRLNFHRTMPLTANFLKENNMVELLGYNKLGDNSYPNLFPALTGLSFDFVKQTCVRENIIDVNKCGFIWDKFKEKGYYTALGSDSIAGLLGNYEYSLPRTPTDFYLQPFIFETRKLFKNQHYNFHQCMGSKFYYKILLDYIYGLTHQLKLNKLFSMFWEESVSHENLNSPRMMDEAYFDFLTSLHRDDYLNKTILILLSDHGMRWGEIVQTEQGRLEERLPLLGILFPEEFTRRYKLAFQNIQRNADRLTTPFDMYETLLDLINPSLLDNNIVKERSESISVMSKSSLFLPISPKRDCKSIGIEEHWCACRRGEKIKVDNNVKTMAAHNLVVQINRLLKDYPQCQKLVLGYIYDVYLKEKNKQWRIYTVTVKTRPGGGIFDGTLIQDASHWVVSGTVSRLNLYRNQSDCVDDASIKMYCYCG